MCKSNLFQINNEAFDLDYSDIQFQIKERQFAYLGVAVTLQFKNLFKEHFSLTSSTTIAPLIFAVLPSGISCMIHLT